jgi:uncharacterized protein
VGPKPIPVVIDTNVWISGLLTKTGAPAQVTRRVVSAGLPAFSADTFAELNDRLWRPKFDRYVTLEQRKAVLRDIQSIALWIDVPPATAARTFCRDPSDDKFIHAALAAASPWLVTGDQDLLVLSKSLLGLGVQIVTPAEALDFPDFPGAR